MSDNIDLLESSDKKLRLKAAESLGNDRTKAALRALLDVTKNDNEKDVRKAAIISVGKLNDPEAVPLLEEISRNDNDRGIRNLARDISNQIKNSGSELPEENGSFSKEDAARAREDFRALEQHEARQPGLNVKIQESLFYKIDQENNLINDVGELISFIKGNGKIEVTNSGSKDRIWAIDATVKGFDDINFIRDESQETTVFGNNFTIKELDPQASQLIPFTFTVNQLKLNVIEGFWDLEKIDSPPTFSRGNETKMRFTLKLENKFPFSVKNITVKKYILDPTTEINNYQTTIGKLGSDSDNLGRKILWQVDNIPANESVEASCELKVLLSEEVNEPYRVGDTVVTYHCFERNLSGLGLETITGSSSVFQFISREEQEENPGDFDCNFELENTSEFEMDLKEVRIYEGDLSEGNIRLEWLGSEFSEEERSIDPGETFKLDPWTITVDSEESIPQFGRELDLSVKYLFDAEVVAECTILGYELPFLGIEVQKSFDPLAIPSYRKAKILNQNMIKSSGSTEIAYLQVRDSIPSGFEPPEKENITIHKGEEQLTEFNLEITDTEVILTLEHLEESNIGTLKQDEEMMVNYPFYVIAKPEQKFLGKTKILGNIYPQVKPISAESEAGPISVIHERRKIKIGKMVRSTSSDALNEYEIILRGVNEGTAMVRNVEISDFLPHGFELASETEEDPPVGFEEHSSVKSGTGLRWIYNEVKPGQKIQIRYKIRALGEHDPKDVYKMLMG